MTSILLAFAVDAAWDERGERQRRTELVEALRTDVEETRLAMLARSEWARGVTQQARRILEAVALGEQGPALDSILFSVGDVFVKGYWAPMNQTYQQALGSGDLALLPDPHLRLLLGGYTEAIESVTELQNSVITQYYGALEPYLVAHTDYAQVAWAGEAEGLVQGPFETDARELAESREFYNLLNLKLELELEVIGALEAALASADALLQGLEEV